MGNLLFRNRGDQLRRRADGVEPRRAVRIPLQVADGLGTDPRPARPAPPGSGPASLRDWLTRTLRIFPDFHAIVEDGFTAGDQVALRITAYGTHRGTGRPVELAVLQISRAGPAGWLRLRRRRSR
jgi:hypothetical protein